MGNEVGPVQRGVENLGAPVAADEKTPRMGMNEADILRAFTYHAPKDDQADRYQDLRNTGWKFATIIDELCPQSREKSLALTKLREAVMWANAAIACNE